MADTTYPLIPAANILAAILVSLTLIASGLRGPYNRGVVMFEGWVLVSLVRIAIQTIIWHGSDELRAPVFCDIGTPINHVVPMCAGLTSIFDSIAFRDRPVGWN